jgi:predicted nucleic acid-binding protein
VRFLDANVVIDALVDQGTHSHERSLSLFRRLLAGEEEVKLTELVFGEILFFFRRRLSRYMSSEEVEKQLLPLALAPAVHLENRSRWGTVLSLAKQSNLDVPDLYHIALAQESDHDGLEIYSYDTDFDRLPGVKRLEP